MSQSEQSSEIKELVQNLLKSAGQKANQGAFEEAAELLSEASELAPENHRVWDLFGFVKWSLKDIEGAEQCNRKSLEIKPLGAYARKGLGICLADQGKVDEGISELHHAMALRPLWIDPIHDLCVVLMNAERYEQAIPMLERALEMDAKLEPQITPLLEKAKAAVAGSQQ